jgi:outer membrane protein assembly factor BamE
MTKKRLLVLVCCLIATSACNLIYKQNIQQGNALEQDKIDQLEIGMTMNQVAFLMGTPAVRDPFHHDRWDYFYSFSIRGGDPTTRLITLKFENAVLKEMTGVDFDDPDRVITAADADDEAAPTAAGEPVSEPTVDTLSADKPNEDSSPVTDPVIEEIAGPAANPETGAADNEHAMPEAAASPVTEPAPAETVQAEQVAPQVHSETAVIETLPAQEPALWIIQLGAFDSLQNAEYLVANAREAGFQTQVISQEVASLGTRYLVRSSGYEDRTQADRQLQMINSALGIEGFLLPPERRE